MAKHKEFPIVVDGVPLVVDATGRIGRRDKAGRVRWLKQTRKASNSPGNPYLVVTINGKKYLAHRICQGAYCGGIMPPALEVDHLSGRRDDNSISNLCYTSRTQNSSRTHPGMRCHMPAAADWCYNGAPVESWPKLAAAIGVTYIALKSWLQINKDRLDGRPYHGGKFTRREQA